jgi:subtilase family serine protease
VQFRTGYSLGNGQASTSQIVAIVDAYNDPNILSDLNVYSDTFGIPRLPACVGAIASSATPCFQKVDQRGGTAYPQTNAGWALEISLDVEIVHAVCQNCSILLVEADSNSFANLMAAVDRAATLGANEISNSYGGGEFSGESSYDSHFNRTGVAITVSSGDSGYGVEYPAASLFVTAVGGTTLNLNSNNSYNSESVWSGAGSGCSAYESKPGFQSDPSCAKRTVADVSADANPNTGAAIYDSVRYQGRLGWFKVGGTSLASPLIAAVYALAGGVSAGTYGNSVPYANGNSGNLHDITSGSNGSCGGSYLCTGVAGYDGPTGRGTPNGTGAF